MEGSGFKIRDDEPVVTTPAMPMQIKRCFSKHMNSEELEKFEQMDGDGWDVLHTWYKTSGPVGPLNWICNAISSLEKCNIPLPGHLVLNDRERKRYSRVCAGDNVEKIGCLYKNFKMVQETFKEYGREVEEINEQSKQMIVDIIVKKCDVSKDDRNDFLEFIKL
uniref:Uncharacterized protein n=1 Tax=Panagrolaimus sp. JU765 TaxID=591449 RepID=A0AC34RBB7_9BILA